MIRRSTLLLAAALSAACSGSSDPSVPTVEETTFAPALGIDLSTFTRNASGLYFKELVVGTGAEAQNGATVGVRYKGQFPDASVFDENPAPEALLTFPVGAGRVVAGFDQGVRGMRVGGKRQLILPPALGYGSRGSGAVPPNAILVFTVDLVTVQ